MDVSSVVTAVGYKSEKNKIRDIIIAISGAKSQTVQLNIIAEYLLKNDIKNIFDDELKKIIKKEVKFTENIKISKRVKLNVIVSHLLDILKSINKEIK